MEQFFRKNNYILSDLNFKKYLSILCIIELIILVVPDDHMLLHSMGNLWDAVTTHNMTDFTKSDKNK